MEFRYRLKKKKAQHAEESLPSQPFLAEGSATADTPLSSLVSSGNDTVQTDSTSTTGPSMSKQSDWRKDKFNISLLLFLYLLQGIPLGMASSLPLIIQTYGANWSQQATFSFAFWPFSLKLLWAPIVDALYVKKLGRRKSWLIPTQYLIGIMMIILSYYVNQILFSIQTSSNSQGPVYLLTSVFFGLSFLAATQDICVDGWALSILARENVGWASTCNSVGQTAGIFIGRVVFLALESTTFANDYIRRPLHMELQSTGMITLSGFLRFWGVVFLASTTLIGIFKREKDQRYDTDEPHFGLLGTYKVLVKVLCLPAVRSTAFILLTIKIGFAATDAMTGLELTERGVTKESVALLAIPLTPLQIILPFLISKYTAGPKPLNVFIVSYLPRVVLGLVLAVFVYYTPAFQNANQTFPWYYYFIAVVIYSVHQITAFNMFVSQMAFFARVSDPNIGGTYMTLLNTMANLGTSWITTVVLYAADYLQWKTCSIGGRRCGTSSREQRCTSLGGVCQPYIDSYYTAVTLCTIAAILWMVWKYRTLLRLQDLPMSAWQVRNHRRSSKSGQEHEQGSGMTNA